MKQAEEVIVVRQAAISKSFKFAHARYTDLQNLLKLKKEANGVLDPHTIQNALGSAPRGNECGESLVQWSLVCTCHCS